MQSADSVRLLYLIVVNQIIHANDVVRQSKVCSHIIGFGSSLVEALLVPRAPAVLRTASKRLAAVDTYCKLYQHRVHRSDSYG